MNFLQEVWEWREIMMLVLFCSKVIYSARSFLNGSMALACRPQENLHFLNRPQVAVEPVEGFLDHFMAGNQMAGIVNDPVFMLRRCP
jgi:hypothetical protein